MNQSMISTHMMMNEVWNKNHKNEGNDGRSAILPPAEQDYQQNSADVAYHAAGLGGSSSSTPCNPTPVVAATSEAVEVVATPTPALFATTTTTATTTMRFPVSPSPSTSSLSSLSLNEVMFLQQQQQQQQQPPQQRQPASSKRPMHVRNNSRSVSHSPAVSNLQSIRPPSLVRSRRAASDNARMRFEEDMYISPLHQQQHQQRKRSCTGDMSVGLPSAYPFCKKLNSSMTTITTAAASSLDYDDLDDFDLVGAASSSSAADHSPLRNRWLSFELPLSMQQHGSYRERDYSDDEESSSFGISSKNAIKKDTSRILASPVTRSSYPGANPPSVSAKRNKHRRNRNQALSSTEFNQDILTQLYIS